MFEFDAKTIEGALGRYSIGMSPEQYQTKDPTTHMKTLRTLYERHTGQQMADAFGDMLWLNPDTLREPQKGAKLAYLYDSSQGESQKEQLAPATRRKYLENARSIVYSAAVFLEALPGDAHRDQYAQLAKNFQAFGPELRELRASEKIRVGAGQLSDDDRRNWAPLDKIQEVVTSACQELLTQGSIPNKQGPWLKAQRTVAAALVVLQPPNRGPSDIGETVFVDNPSEDELESLAEEADVMNYIDLGAQPPAIVFNHHKRDRLRGERGVLGHENTIILPLVQTDLHTKLGFDMDLLVRVLTHYHNLMRQEIAARNPHMRLFWNYKPGASMEPLKGTALGDRIKEFFRAAVGGGEDAWLIAEDGDAKRLGGRMLRKITVTDMQKRDLADYTPEERKQMAEWMNHGIATHQGGAYNKRDV
jgi:hypothetical protein